MSTYRVNWTLEHDGVRHEAGAEIELDDGVAAELGDVVTKVKTTTRKTSKPKPKPKTEADE